MLHRAELHWAMSQNAPNPQCPWALSHLPSGELVNRLQRLVNRNSELTAHVLAHVGEVDARKLYLRAACPSMFAYCTDVLRLSEAATYKRIHAARAARKHPVIFEMVSSGQLHLSAVCMLASRLTPDNCDELLNEAAGCSKRQVEKLLARRFPSPDVETRVRALPRRRASSKQQETSQAMPLLQGADVPRGQGRPVPRPPIPMAAPSSGARASQKQPDVMEPLSERRYKIQLTADQSLHDKLRQAQELLGDRVAPNDLAAVFEQGLDLLVRDLRRKRFAETKRPRRPKAEPVTTENGQGPTASAENEDNVRRTPRYIPAEVRRTVARRDGHQCTFVDAETGRRCPERSNLQYHHDHPWGRGGSREPENIKLLCRPHNLYMAEQDYGSEHMARFVTQKGRADQRRRDEGNRAREESPVYVVQPAGEPARRLGVVPEGTAPGAGWPLGVPLLVNTVRRAVRGPPEVEADTA